MILAGFIIAASLLALTVAAWIKLEIHWLRIKKMRNHEPR